MKYYFLSLGFERGYAYSRYEKDSVVDYDAADKCPLCGQWISMAPHVPPYNVVLSTAKIGDFIFGLFHYFIVSARVKELYEKSGLTGIKEFRKIDRLRVRKEIIDAEYYGIVPERVNVRPEPIEVKYLDDVPVCELCNPNGKMLSTARGLRMNLNGQDGAPDVFTTYVTGMSPFCTQRFVDFCRENKFTNFDKHVVPFENYTLGIIDK